MSYLHMDNLYRSQDILLFREAWAMEKVHGTSAHVRWADGVLTFSSGGESHDRFVDAVWRPDLRTKIEALGHPTVVVYGEAYGGACMKMKAVYGPELRFIVFEVKIGESWLSVPDADAVAQALGLEFVPYRKIGTTLPEIDAERDRPSEVAVRRGCGTDKAREGIVLRPLIEVTKNNGERIIAKHKSDTFSERATPQKVVDPSALAVLEQANAIAQEWVSEMRLTHVLDKMPGASIEQMKDIIRAMTEDVYREAKGEIVESREAQAAIGKRTALLFKARLQARLHEVAE